MTDAKAFLKRANDLENLINTLSTAKLSREERIEQMNKLRILRSEIFHVISQLDNCTYQCILIEKYVNNSSWEDISNKLHYCEKYVRCELHSKALIAVGVILNASK